MRLVLSSPFSFYLGKIGSVSVARVVAGVYFGSRRVVFEKNDSALAVLKQAQMDHKKVLCIFEEAGTISQVVVVFVGPKGQFLQELKKDLNSFGKGYITLSEVLDQYIPKYQRNRK